MELYIEKAKNILTELGYEFVVMRSRKLDNINTIKGLVSYFFYTKFEGIDYRFKVTAHTFEKYFYITSDKMIIRNKRSLNGSFKY